MVAVGYFLDAEKVQQLADRLGVPVIPTLPLNAYDPNPVVAICGECGRKIQRFEGYWCASDRCPVQPRVIA